MISHDLAGVEPFSLRRVRDKNGIIAEGDERLKDGSEVCASGAGEQAGDVMSCKQLCKDPPSKFRKFFRY